MQPSPRPSQAARRPGPPPWHPFSRERRCPNGGVRSGIGGSCSEAPPAASLCGWSGPWASLTVACSPPAPTHRLRPRLRRPGPWLPRFRQIRSAKLPRIGASCRPASMPCSPSGLHARRLDSLEQRRPECRPRPLRQSAPSQLPERAIASSQLRIPRVPSPQCDSSVQTLREATSCCCCARLAGGPLERLATAMTAFGRAHTDAYIHTHTHRSSRETVASTPPATPAAA